MSTNHYAKLDEAPNVEFQDLWDTNKKPLLRNRIVQTKPVLPGFQFLSSYNDAGRIEDGAQLEPDADEDQWIEVKWGVGNEDEGGNEEEGDLRASRSPTPEVEVFEKPKENKKRKRIVWPRYKG